MELGNDGQSLEQLRTGNCVRNKGSSVYEAY